ncbi:LysM peptidoglycan-binding domain-containing protein [Alloprevotella tannerae]|uniref:PBP1 and LysM peptidoglycan-binding domain-containing protein n=1 Tax=Alloprevotella tannerae TaxID=76122 RepID=UPI00288AFC8D|nr:LysM peptidoglycan-binding domain-containing protein [Alloprevotella tannerae]
MKVSTHIMRLALLCFSFLLYAQIAEAQQKSTPHVVQGGETLYSLARLHHTTIDKILSINPGLTVESLQAGQTILLPTGGAAESPITHVVSKGDTMWNIAKRYNITVDELVAANPEMKQADYKLKKGSIINIPAVTTASNSPTQTATPISKTVGIAFLLPMKATGVEGERSVEFYRGFLMAADKLRDNGRDINIYTYNEDANQSSLVTIINKLKTQKPDVIIGPVYPAHFTEVANFAKEQQIRMVVPFSSKAWQVHTTPQLCLLNTPMQYQQIFAADLFLKIFKIRNAVFMHINNANEQTFTQQLKGRLNAAGVTTTVCNLDAPLTQLKSACAKNKQTVIVPDNSDPAVLRQLLERIKQFCAQYPKYKVSLFGYPGWLDHEQALREDFHVADTYIYTNAFYNPYSRGIAEFNAQYKAWFNAEPLDVTPRMGLLGYDLATHLLQGFFTYGKNFTTQRAGTGMLQSDMRFAATEAGGGLVNNSVSFIHYKNDRTIEQLQSR